MKLNGTRYEKRSPRKITKFRPRNGGQKTNLQLTRAKSNGVSLRKLQLEKISQQSFVNKNTGILALFRRITRPFIPLLIFPFIFQRLVHFKRKNPVLRRSKRISLRSSFPADWSGPYAGFGWENPDRWNECH